VEHGIQVKKRLQYIYHILHSPVSSEELHLLNSVAPLFRFFTVRPQGFCPYFSCSEPVPQFILPNIILSLPFLASTMGLIHSSTTTLITLLQVTGRSKTGGLAVHVDAFPSLAVNRVRFVVDGSEVVVLDRSVPSRPCFSMQRTLCEGG
jgi:hypothetical protein